MKVCDKVICIKEYRSENFGISFLESCIYNISEINVIKGENIIVVEYRKSNGKSAGLGVAFYESIKPASNRLFKDYFITLKESRKLKLNKINESNLY